jgi:hypothetical protein
MELKKEAMLPILKALILKRSSLNNGSVARCSMNGNAMSKPAPVTRDAITKGLVHPMDEVPYGNNP